MGARHEDERAMERVAVLNIVGLSRSLLGPALPRITAWAQRAGVESFAPAFPAVTCTAQASYVTGVPVAAHGVVANGWYDRESAEVRFWKQSDHLVRGEKIWERLRRELAGFTCAKHFWWYNMYSSADYAMTPRPLYPADGRKVFDVHTQPMGDREAVKAELGPFPFPAFWGPAAGIASSRWIADSAKWTERRYRPTLNLIYLPHLDYGLQKWGPRAPEMAAELAEIDAVVGDLLDFFDSRGVRVLGLSEYGISAVNRPVHLNRLFRKQGWLSLKNELGRETLDVGGCEVFAVADHQVAHVYVKQPDRIDEVRAMLSAVSGVAEVRDAAALWGVGPARERGGDLVAVAEPGAWFTYYFWEDDALAPDFARCIDIHRKPGYDPAELFIDPAIRFPKARIAAFLAKKKLGLRGLLEVIPLDAGLVRGSHGRDEVAADEQAVWIGGGGPVAAAEELHGRICAAVRGKG